MQPLFGALGHEPIDMSVPDLRETLRNMAGALQEPQTPNWSGPVAGVGYSPPAPAAPPRNNKQFGIYRLGDDKAPIVDPHNTEPELEGSDKEPDAELIVELEAFNFSRMMKVDDRTQATLRLDLGKASEARSNLDLLFWSAASAIDLAGQLKKKDGKASDVNFKSASVFKSGPAQIPGGLGKISIEVVKHEPPTFLGEIWSAITGKAGKSLITTLGFPAITLEALDFLNGVYTEFAQKSAEPLFQSQPIRFALTKRAKEEFVDGSATKVAALSRGRYVFATPQDAAALSSAVPLYLGGSGILVPKADYDRNPNTYDATKSPLNDITYGILRVRAKTAQLDWMARL